MFRRALSTSLRQTLDSLVSGNRVLVFMKGSPAAPQCGFSKAVCQVLELQGVHSYKSIDVLQDPELRQGLKEYSQWPTIPQVYVGGDFVGGTDILVKMHQSGELGTLLERQSIIKPS